MTREEKHAEVQQLTTSLADFDHVYLTDSSELSVDVINQFRRKCFEHDITFKVVKNTLLKKAMEESELDYEELYEFLSGPTAIMLTQTANAPAKVLKDFRKDFEKPMLKAAFIDASVFAGDESIEQLAALKSKEELLGEIVGLLQSPIKTVVGGLKSSGGNKIAGLVKALQEREEN